MQPTHFETFTRNCTHQKYTNLDADKNYSSDTSSIAEHMSPLLMTGNVAEQHDPQVNNIPQLVAMRASETPDAIALVMGTSVLSYKELNARANQLAHYLQTLGVGPNVLVGLCIERSLDMVVGLLGILKAGGAYVPLDSTYPAERIAFMLTDAQVSVLITRQQLASHLPTQGTHVICFDADAIKLAERSESEPYSSTTVDDLVYVIYTSGSTGRPKGVQITHKNLLNLVYWHQQEFNVTPDDRATQVSSPAFDATGWELWPYLTAGASVYLPDEDTRVSPPALKDWLVSNGITISFVPTVLAESLLALEWPTTTALRFLLTGADTLHTYPSPTLPFALINNYGPTEATVVATSGRVLPLSVQTTDAYASIPSIGRPIANTRIYILNEQMQQPPDGEAAELYIGGASVARGYLNRPELTSERFIPDPFSDEPDARLYKTGDLGRYLPDGQIAFLGRTDHQIKIRGYRIEPDEIVSALNEHPAVQASYIVAREVTGSEKQLVAYIVPVTDITVSASSLQELLSSRLPVYMIPATFVQMDALPLTPNGKVDRAALPAPNAQNMLQNEETDTPGTPVEELLVGLLAPLLGLEQVGIDDNFFMLGGHSLLGTQLITRIADTFGVTLTLRTLFDAPTVRELAAEIELRLIAKVEAMSDEEVRLLLK
jgi:amino acid adenylation domain-containing protein